MSNTATKIFGSVLLVCALHTSSLFAQTQVVQFTLDSSEQGAFWDGIREFKPQPLEHQGDTLRFLLPNQSSRDSFCLLLLNHFRQRSYLLASIDPDSSHQSPVTNPPVTSPPITNPPVTNPPVTNPPIHQSTIQPVNQLHLGPAMRWVSLHPGESFSGDRWLSFAEFRTKLLNGKPLHYQTVLKLEQAILEHAENNGYPFAQVWLDSVVVDGREVSAVLQVEKNRFFVYKGLKIHGEVKLPKAFMPNYLGIKIGAPYNRAQVLRLRDQLRSLVFVESTSNPSVTFSGDPTARNGDATVNLFLQKKRASRFDFLIGLLPQPNATDGKLLLTGTLSAAFQNALNLGERFSAELERLRPETQKMDIQASIPYILGSSFGAEGRLGIFRRDSTWTDAQGELGASYLFAGAEFVRFFWENKTSSLQKVDTLSVLNTRRLPPNLDYRQNGFGLEASFSRLDYTFNPRRGWSASLKTVTGFNTVRRNSQIENLKDPDDSSFSFSTLYDSLEGKTARFRAELRAEAFVPVFIRSTIKFAIRSGGIFSKAPVYANENYRLGGNKLLRGFDEESLFATRFVVGTAEWRLLIGPNSFLSAFTDWGYLEDMSVNKRIFLRPLGLGAGLNFETKAGIFGISAAVGRRDVGQSVDFRSTKFHLGYVSLF